MSALKVLAFLAFLLVVVVLALFAGMGGMGWMIGPDIGFAGGGIWLLGMPSAAVGLVIGALLAYRFGSGYLPSFAARNTAFALLSIGISFFGAALLVQGWRAANYHPPEFVYVQGPPTLELQAPTEALAGVPIEVRALRRAGAWKAVPYKQMRDSGREFSYAPLNGPQTDVPNGPYMSLEMEPHMYSDEARATGFAQGSGIARVVFGKPGAVKLWAALPGEAPLKSREIVVNVRWREPAVPIVHNADARGRPFGRATILAVWNKARPADGYDPREDRYTVCGRPIRFAEYGTTSETGWEIDHIRPLAKGGTDQLGNLQPLHRNEILRKSDSFPWNCQLDELAPLPGGQPAVPGELGQLRK